MFTLFVLAVSKRHPMLHGFKKAADLNINPLAYRQLAKSQIHYALGDTGRSFVVGFGVNPPVKPHHASRFEWKIL
jgi:hypothetical protein